MAMVDLLFKNSDLAWIPYLVGTLFGISFGGITLIFSMALYRRWRDQRMQRVTEAYREKIVEIVCAESDENLPVIKPRRSERLLVRNLLLSTIASVQGDSKRRLNKIYKDQFFLAYDYLALKSPSFSLRLGALARMETVRDIVSEKLVIRHLQDRSPYVHFAALRFLLKKPQAYYPVIEEEMAQLEKLKRYDTALEILSCYAQAYPDRFIEYFSKAESSKIRSAALEVIYRKRLTEGLPYVRELLKAAVHDVKFSPADILEFKKAIQCLTISPMPENEEVLTDLSYFSVPEVRTLAFRAWLLMRPDCFTMIVEQMLEDESEQIRTMALQLKRRDDSTGRAA